MDRVTEFANKTQFIYSQNADTPRSALCINFSLNDPIPYPGVYSLMARLFMQGTKTRNARVLSEELDKYAIEFSAELKPDYLKFKIVCLNEDFDKALEILDDIIKNTTFDDFEKERMKMAGEIQAELDSPRNLVVDNYYKNLYDGHFYGYTNTVILENLPNVTKQQVIDGYKTFCTDSRKVISFVGDIEYERVYAALKNYFEDFNSSVNNLPALAHPELKENKTVQILKPDVNQAHIIKGWIVPTFGSEDYPALALLNVILGASGLSSRLFLELREKKGLAYVVRSSYETARLAANFSIYIATEPKNIETALQGFEEEINKIKNIQVSDVELENAKNNLIGKWAFVTETNSQQANYASHFAVNGVGYDYLENAKKLIKNVTPKDIIECANKYLDDKFVITILKP